ncbi:hypothetical protein ACFFRS_27350, partial [Saccharopolyspora hordei]|uniref:DUF7342 family protein n=1 Tax=Saccharopolyspora hordei TaxID=1838 RepID=UPI0035EB7A03
VVEKTPYAYYYAINNPEVITWAENLKNTEKYRINTGQDPSTGWKIQDREEDLYENEEPLPDLDRELLPESEFERVRAIAEGVAQPQSVSCIADEAHVPENSAKEHLERLVQMSVLRRSDRRETTMYAPNPLHTRRQTVRDLLDDNDQNNLIELKADIQGQIKRWRDEYEVKSPTELRDRASDTSDIAEARKIQQTANNWELVLYRLSLIEEAIKEFTTQ